MLWKVALLAFFGTMANAEPVKVTSGEHSGFTRLVFQFSTVTDWKFGKTDAGYGLQTSSSGYEYDLSKVFSTIRRDRVSLVEFDSGSNILEISIPCLCHAVPFELRPGIVVVDIKDGLAEASSRFESDLVDGPDALVPFYLRNEAITETKSLAEENDAKIVSALSLDPRMTNLQTQLLERLAIGATDGVIELSIPSSPEIPTSKLEVKGDGVFTNNAAIKIQDNLNFSESQQGNVECVEPHRLDISAWIGEGDFASQLVAARGQMIGEFDQESQENLRNSIRTYLYFGFGLEAIQLMLAFDVKDDDAALWVALATLMDGDLNTPFFNGQESCDGPAALWALMGSAEGLDPELVNKKAVLLAFSNLPAHLRAIVGPKLIGLFSGWKDEQSVAQVKNSVKRGYTDLPVDIAMANQISGTAELGEPTQMSIASLVSKEGADSATALVKVVDNAVLTLSPLEPTVALAISAHIAEFGDDPLAAELQRAFILATAAAGDFEAALKATDDPNLIVTIVEMLGKFGSDDALLKGAFLEEVMQVRSLSADGAKNIAERLIGLGFPDVAANYAPEVTDAVQPDISPLKADTGPEQQNPDGDALEPANPNSEAPQPQSEAEAVAMEQALARDWDGLAQMPEGVWSDAARRNATSAVEDSTTLKGAGQLVLESDATRSALKELLSTVENP